MLAQVYSGAVYGVDAYSVEIEVNAGHGDPAVVIVGLPDAAVKESNYVNVSFETIKINGQEQLSVRFNTMSV